MPDVTTTLQELLKSHILMLDGAMGTMIQGYQLTEADYRGSRFASTTSGRGSRRDRPDVSGVAGSAHRLATI